VSGFTTEEIREGRRRVGFAVEAASGERGVLAHVGFPGPPRVGKYGVDLPAFERIALPALSSAESRGVVVVDELGKLELASGPFRDKVPALFETGAPVVATVHVHRHPFTDDLKARPDVEVVRLTAGNRDELPPELAARIAASLGEPERPE
jgi:nucleoside-triphosphatase